MLPSLTQLSLKSCKINTIFTFPPRHIAEDCPICQHPLFAKRTGKRDSDGEEIVTNDPGDLEDWEMTPAGAVFVTDCQHWFHATCIRNWIRTQQNATPPDEPTCPACREALIEHDVQKLLADQSAGPSEAPAPESPTWGGITTQQYVDSLRTNPSDALPTTARRYLSNGGPLATNGDDLVRAATNGHDDVTKILLSHGADVNASSRPLVFAAARTRSRENYMNMLKLLLERGADVNGTFFGITALMEACGLDGLGYSTPAVKLLLAAGANVDGGNAHPATLLPNGEANEIREMLENRVENNDKLRDAVDEDRMDGENGFYDLIDNKGASIHQAHELDYGTVNYMVDAAFYGNKVDLLKEIFKRNVKIIDETAPPLGETAYTQEVARRQFDLLIDEIKDEDELLADGGRHDASYGPGSDGEKCIHVLLANGAVAQRAVNVAGLPNLQRILQQHEQRNARIIDEIEEEEFIDAIINTIDGLIDDGANVNCVVSTPDSINTPLCAVANVGDVALLKHLIQRGMKASKIRVQDGMFASPLHLAVANGDTEMIVELVKMGQQINEFPWPVNTPEMTPLCYGVEQRNITAVVALLEMGAYVTRTARAAANSIPNHLAGPVYVSALDEATNQ